jgi:hypothetical protein
MARADFKFSQSTIPQAVQSLKQMYRDKENEIHRPTDFTFSHKASILAQGESVFAERAKPLGGRIVLADRSPFVQTNTLFHFHYLLFFLCVFIIA